MEKSHRAENLSSCSYSAFCAYPPAIHHDNMMHQIGRRKEVTDSAWRLLKRQLGSRPPWSVGACLLANLPSKNTCHKNPQHMLTRRDLNGRQQPPWCPTPGAAAYNSQPACWLIVVCGRAGSGAPWRQWNDGGCHGRWGMVWLALASFYPTKLIFFFR
jgi:hypothetical protein